MAHLNAKFIIEILGRPADHLKTALTDLVDKIGTEKGVAILSKEIHDPKKAEKAENLWTSFAEIDLRFETLTLFFNALMTYLPAHVEVYEPDNFKLNTFEVNEFANFVVGKLHNYDALAKSMMGERDILINKLEYLRQGGDIKKVFENTVTTQGSGTEEKPAKKKNKKKKK